MVVVTAHVVAVSVARVERDALEEVGERAVGRRQLVVDVRARGGVPAVGRQGDGGRGNRGKLSLPGNGFSGLRPGKTGIK